MNLKATAGASDNFGAGLVANGRQEEKVAATGRYRAECFDKDGVLKWVEEFDNVVTTVGKNLIATGAFANAAQGAPVMGLKGTGTAVAADTQASHGSWLEVGLANAPTYTGNRQVLVPGVASGGVVTASALSFSITSTGTVAGAFINVGGSATKDNTTGTLVSAGDFAAPRSVASGDTLNVTYSLTIS